MSRYPTYIVIIHIPMSCYINVGALGRIFFEKGYYVYIGSGGRYPIKRIKRHFRRNKKLKWHIDYITIVFPAIEAYIMWGLEGGEEVLAQDLQSRYCYVPGFGSSDKSSKSHFFYIGNRAELDKVIDYFMDKYSAEKVSISDGDNILHE